MPRLILPSLLLAFTTAGLAVSFDGSLPAGSSTESRSTECAHPNPLIGLTAPIRTVTLASIQQGRIAAVHAAEGQFVGQGQIVFSLDDSVQQANVEIAAARAESSLEVDLARARWERAERDREWRIKLHGDERASSKELNDATSDAEVLGLEYKLAVFANAQAGRTLDLQHRLADQYHVKAPFGGYVSEVKRKPGETVDQFDVVLTLVQIDSLEVALDCPIALAPCLREGDRLKVQPLDKHWPVRQGTVVLANLVADGGSQTFKVKLLVDNADRQWMAGIKVSVEVSQIERPKIEAE